MALSPCFLSCLLSSRTLKCVGLHVLYRHISISQPPVLREVLRQIRKYPVLQTSVRELDFKNLCTTAPITTGDGLLDLLNQTPLIRKFSVSKHIDGVLSSNVLRKLFCGLPYITSLDLSDCNSSTFVEACFTLVSGDQMLTPLLASLNLAGCSSLPSELFELLLPQLPGLRFLDVSHTQINSAAISSIPATARLTHLNFSHCCALRGAEVVKFLIEHAATKGVVNVNIEMDQKLEDRVFREEDVSRLLANVPSSLRILNFKGSAMTSTHLPLLKPLTTQLEEICFGSNMRFSDVEQLILKTTSLEIQDRGSNNNPEEETETVESKYHPVLTPMEEAIAICKLRQNINSVPDGISHSRPKYIDISSLPVMDQCAIRTSILLAPRSRPLKIVEISEEVLRRFGVLTKACKAVGWDVKCAERRCWLRRHEDQ